MSVELANSIDEFVQELACDFHRSKALSEENSDLNSKVKVLMTDLKNLHEVIESKDLQITTLAATIESLQKEKSTFIDEFSKDLTSQTQVTDMKYEVCNLTLFFKETITTIVVVKTR